jgi:uroporphyrin-III C-methyltransferase/precorrin-2 dehydrogenase/sirohydrochlorin ferrochelatase
MTELPNISPQERVPVMVPARIAPLPNLPLFHKMEGRKAVVAGRSPGAVWKAELLSAAGAEVLVLAGGAIEPFGELAARPVQGPVTVLERNWAASDLADAAIAVGDLAERQDALAFVAAARAAGAPVNMIDHTELCDVQFGTIVNRSPVILAISTDGAAPMLGQSIRARIESILPLGLSAWAKAASEWRPDLKHRLESFAERRAFWSGFVARAWANVDRAPTEADRETLIARNLGGQRKGRVYLVGAGPGDPELLTLRAVRALQSATVILYDDLVGAEILELARREARRVAVGKTGHGPSCTQADINSEIVRLANAGEIVVRLKGGDPLIFGRATEEIEACQRAGIEVTLVPGISAALGAAASLGFSLTERREARRIQFVTGHGADGKLPEDIDWRAIADPSATTAIYMPRKTLAGFAAKAVESGLSPATPAVAIASATLPQQQQVTGTLGTIAALAERLPVGAPVVVILGRVARHAEAAIVRQEAA